MDRGQFEGVNEGEQCRAGWIAVHTTALCLRFDSPTLGPHFPIPRPIVLLLGCIASHRVGSHQVGSHRVGSHHLVSGRITSRRVVLHCIASCHIASGRIALHWVASHCVKSHRIALHCVSRAIIGSHCTVINPIRCAIPPCYCSSSCTLSSCSFCEGLAFTYTSPYLASVTVTLGACPLL